MALFHAKIHDKERNPKMLPESPPNACLKRSSKLKQKSANLSASFLVVRFQSRCRDLADLLSCRLPTIYLALRLEVP